MIKNYFKTALRSLFKHKIFTFINIVGLAIGISAAMVIYLVVQYDLSFDKFHADGDRIYRVVSDYKNPGGAGHNSGVPLPLNKAIDGVTGIEQAAPFRNYGYDIRITVPAPNTAPAVFKNQEKVMICDGRYFKLFNYQWIAGSPVSALTDPNHVVLTQSRAKLYFPDLKPAQIINKTVVYDDSLTLSVSGIVADIKENTDLTFHDFISVATIEHKLSKPSGGDIEGGFDATSWNSTSSYDQLFIKIAKQSTAAHVDKQLNALLTKNRKVEDPSETVSFGLQPLSTLHFNADYDNFDQRQANATVLYSLLGVAAFLLMLGCINFINLTTARSSQRAREIGVRKTIGGTRNQLIGQFLTETFIVTFIAAILSIGLAYYLLELFANFIPDGVQYSQLFRPNVLLFILLLVSVVSVISGLYPAVVMSSYRPVEVLKGSGKVVSSGKVSFSLRKALTVVQFIIAQFFIMATLLVSSQINYLLSKDLGFKKDAVLYVRTPYKLASSNKKQVFYDKIKAIPQIAGISLAGDAPSSGNTHSTQFTYKDGKTERKTEVQYKFGDTNYITVYQIKLLAGRNLRAADTANLIVNDTYRKFLGLKTPEQAIGKIVDAGGEPATIVGVVGDFYQSSLRHAIEPVAICFGRDDRYKRTLHIALKPQIGSTGNWKTAITKMEAAWHQVFPDDDFEYRFVDESIARFYAAEQNTGKLLNWAAGLSVLISCLGLLGLAIYTTSQRTKEIGIRKVMGATVSQIVSMLSIDFVKLIVVAFVIAIPIAWYVMHQWLQNFAYHTNVTVWLFVGTILATVSVALLTMSFQTIKAAMMNPVKSLRSE